MLLNNFVRLCFSELQVAAWWKHPVLRLHVLRLHFLTTTQNVYAAQTSATSTLLGVQEQNSHSSPILRIAAKVFIPSLNDLS